MQFTEQEKFVYTEVSILAWSASVQRVSLYNPDIAYADREVEPFRTAVMGYINSTLLPHYLKSCADDVHIKNITDLSTFGTKAGAGLLGPDGYKFGVAQKLLNLLLKYLWCLGHIPEPPHCPVDRIILGRTHLKGKVNWTQLVSAGAYKDAIAAIKTAAQRERLSIAKWELREFARR
jgi:hypothetical protein